MGNLQVRNFHLGALAAGPNGVAGPLFLRLDVNSTSPTRIRHHRREFGIIDVNSASRQGVVRRTDE
jgi:hypothetical protein